MWLGRVPAVVLSFRVVGAHGGDVAQRCLEHHWIQVWEGTNTLCEHSLKGPRNRDGLG